MQAKSRLLIVADTYEPGWRAGGPVQSLKNLSELLSADFDLFVLTLNHDHLDDKSYAGIESDVWTRRGGTRVLYVSEDIPSYVTLRRVIQGVKPETAYLTGVMSRFTRRILALGRTKGLSSTRIVLAPQGQLSAMAIANKPVRKKAYLRTATLMGAFDNVVWHASSPSEAEDIRRVIKCPSRIVTVPDIARPPEVSLRSHTKNPGQVSFISVSRIAPIKNIHWLVRLFEQAVGKVTIRLVGPREPDYWNEVANAARDLPPNVSFEYLGAVHPSEIKGLLTASDFFVSPTLSENFGHAIYDSLSVGVPALISDRTPWSPIEAAGAGWVMSPTDSRAWVDALSACTSMTNREYAEHSRSALRFSQDWFHRQAYKRRYKDLFRS